MVAVNGAGGSGSGYVIAPRLVLTSAHVVPVMGGVVSLFHPGRAPSWRGTVVWRGTPGQRDDAALVRIDDPGWVPPTGAPVRWGRLVTHLPGTPCEAWGVPELVQRPGRATDTLHPSGTLNPGDRHVGNRYVMNLGQHPPADMADGSSPWGGMSGAALFCGGLLTGVIAVDPTGRAHAALEAVPAYVLMHDAAFRAVLAEHVRDLGMLLEPVEWQHLVEAAEPAPSGLVGSPAALLRARRQVVPFRGRTEVMEGLRNWCEEAGFGARLLYGPGGQGKTRLAQHLTDTQASEGWSTLWLSGDADSDALGVLAAAAVPLLIVVDYAETRTTQLAALLQAAARHAGGGMLKLLMLARTAGDWWQALQAASPIAEELLEGAQVTALPVLEPEAGASRVEAYEQAVHSYAAHLRLVNGWQHHDWLALAVHLAPSEQEHAGTGSRLDRPGLQTALTLHMTALADLLDTAEDTRVTGPHGVEDRLLAHERRYWTTAATTRALHPALTLETLTDALAAAFLLGAETRSQGEELLRRVPSLADQTNDRLSAIRAWIAALYPTTGSRPWGTLQPDRLTERFIGRHLEAHPELTDHLIPLATDEQAAQLLTFSTRAAAHPVLDHRLAAYVTSLCVRHAAVLTAPAIDVATQTEAPQPLLDALHQITDAPGTLLPDLERLTGWLPDISHNLAPWAAHLTRLLVDQHRTRAHDNPDHRPYLATSLNDLSIRLGDLGRWEEALVAITEAVYVFRELVGLRPDVYRPDLAMSLNNLATGLGSLGRWEEALAAITEALDVYRELAGLRPDAYRPDLATGLSNFSIRLGELGRWEEALAAVTEAVDIRRELARLRPDAHRPELAASLSNFSIRLGGLGRWEEALAAVTEAVDIRRELARLRPDAHRRDLALSLNNLAADLGMLGRQEEALAAVTEAVDIRRELARLRPDVYGRDLAAGLNNLANGLGDLGRWEEALAAVTEAVDIRRELARLRPDVYRPDLAMGLNNLAASLGDLGRWEEALTAITEALDVYRELARLRPDVYRPDLAMGLNNLAASLGSLGRWEEGLGAVTEAVDVYRELARLRPDAYRPELAASLNNLATGLGSLGRWEEGLGAVTEAVEVFRELARLRPDAYRPDLATSLNTLSIRLGMLGRWGEALVAVTEAVRIRRELATLRPGVHQDELDRSLHVFSWLQSNGKDDPSAEN
ncbi:tetratricopeptide repeat protein [Streptomyces sp. NPDC054958]